MFHSILIPSCWPMHAQMVLSQSQTSCSSALRRQISTLYFLIWGSNHCILGLLSHFVSFPALQRWKNETHSSSEPMRRASSTRSRPDFHIWRMLRVRLDILWFPLTGTRAGAMFEISSSLSCTVARFMLQNKNRGKDDSERSNLGEHICRCHNWTA
jgi:hypothetical protein